MIHRQFAIVVAVVFAACVSPCVHADLIDTSGSYLVEGTNFPIDFSESVALDGSVKTLAGGRLEVFERVTADGPEAEWIEFVFSTPDGSPLADDVDSMWMIDLQNIPTTELAFVDFPFVYWTIDGAAVDPITPFTGFPFSVVNANPIDPLLGDVFGGPIDPLVGPDNSFSPSVFALPYNLVSNGGVDPQLANGFTLGFRVSSVPEPGVVLLGLVGVLGLVSCRRRRG